MDQLDLEKLGPFLESYTALVLRIMQQGAIAEAAARCDSSLVHTQDHTQARAALPPARQLPAPLPASYSSPPALPPPVTQAPTTAPSRRGQRFQNLLAIALVLLAFWYLGRMLRAEILTKPPAPPPSETIEPPPALPPIPH